MDIPSITNMINVNSAMNAIAVVTNLMTYVIIGLMVGGAFIFIIWKTKAFFSFPISVDIFQMKGGVLTQVDTDKLRRSKNSKTGEVKMVFKKRGEPKTPLTYEAYVQMKKGSKLYLEELTDGGYKVIDMKTLLSAKPDDYKRFENEELDRFYKNTQDDAAFNKYQKKSDWQRFLDALPAISIIIAAGIFFWLFGTYLVIPMLQMQSAFTGQATTILDKAIQTADAQTRYMEVLLKQAGIEMPTNETYGNNSVIP